jgi:hypothetical protein
MKTKENNLWLCEMWYIWCDFPFFNSPSGDLCVQLVDTKASEVWQTTKARVGSNTAVLWDIFHGSNN